MKLINIAFDLDGTLVDLMTTVKRLVAEDYDVEVMPQNQWKMITEPQVTSLEVWKCIHKAYKMLDSTHPYPGAQELLQKLFHLSGCADPIKIITARPITSAHHAYMLMDTRFTGFDYELILTEKDEKLMYLNRYSCMVEDKAKTAVHLAEHGKSVFLLDRPYNQMPPIKNIVRIKDIRELLPWVHHFIIDSP
jgi:uncharacterized HAD superfamily protein